jgi:hypothetical protein
VCSELHSKLVTNSYNAGTAGSSGHTSPFKRMNDESKQTDYEEYLQGNAIQQLWRIAEEVSVELVTLKKKLVKAEDELGFAKKNLSKKEKELVELQVEYQNSGFLSNLKSSITGVCKRRNAPGNKRHMGGDEENPMSMFHDEIEDL